MLLHYRVIKYCKPGGTQPKNIRGGGREACKGSESNVEILTPTIAILKPLEYPDLFSGIYIFKVGLEDMEKGNSEGIMKKL